MNVFETKTVKELLSGNSYPGRGILIGTSGDGSAVIAYFIMGRSENSRNRVFEMKPDGLYTRAFDESKVEDPSLIIYRAVGSCGNHTVVTNGDQTDTVLRALEQVPEPKCVVMPPEIALRVKSSPPSPSMTCPHQVSA